MGHPISGQLLGSPCLNPVPHRYPCLNPAPHPKLVPFVQGCRTLQTAYYILQTTDLHYYILHYYRYLSFKDADRAEVLVSGRAVQINHMEANGCIGITHSVQQSSQNSKPVSVIPSDTGNAYNSNGAFELERAAAREGSVCKWSESFRIRHVSTGQLLTCFDKPSQQPGPTTRNRSHLRATHEESSQNGQSSRQLTPRLATLDGADTEADEEETMTVALSGKRDMSSATLFALEPLYTRDAELHLEQFFRIRHVGSNFWLHLVKSSSEQSDSEPSSRAPSRSAARGAQSKTSLPFVASRKLHAQDVFVMQRFPRELLDDLDFVNGATDPFENFSLQLAGIKEGKMRKRDLNYKAITTTLEDLIRHTTTATTNQNPLTREGLPHVPRQTVLLEQGMMSMAMNTVTQLFKDGTFEHSEMLDRDRGQKANPSLRLVGQLSMRLVRHILRDNAASKARGMDHVTALVDLLECDILAADTLTELFKNNEQVVDRIRADGLVERFIELIRTVGCKARYIRTLMAMCECHGKAVRPNQWRVAELLLEEKELLPQLWLNDDKVEVMGSTNCMPEETSSMELAKWLYSVPPEMVAYFDALLELYSVLVRGRNKRTTPTLQAMLPVRQTGFELHLHTSSSHIVFIVFTPHRGTRGSNSTAQATPTRTVLPLQAESKPTLKLTRV